MTFDTHLCDICSFCVTFVTFVKKICDILSHIQHHKICDICLPCLGGQDVHVSVSMSWWAVDLVHRVLVDKMCDICS